MTQPQQSPNQGPTYQQALAAATAAQAALAAGGASLAAVTMALSTGVAAARATAEAYAKTLILAAWATTDPYDGRAVQAFTETARRHMVAAQTSTARAAAAAQAQLLGRMGIQVSGVPTNPVDVRAPGADVVDGALVLRRSDTIRVDYDTRATKIIKPDEFTTEAVFNRPARTLRALEAEGATRTVADEAARQRIERIVEDDVMLAQRFAEAEILTRAVDLDAPVQVIIGYRRVIHPELSETGVCGLCIAAADQKYKIGTLLPIHARCKCTVAAITLDHDPADDVNQADLAALYEQSGGTSGAELKRVRYQVDEHGELGPTVVPKRKYKPRSKGSQKSAGPAPAAAESDVEVARRQLPLLEANLVKLREQGMAEDSSQVEYHNRQIARYRERLAAGGGSVPASGASASRSATAVMERDTPRTAPGSTGGGGGRPPTPPTGGGQSGGLGDGDDPRFTDSVRKHILDGDSRGGGHRSTSTEPGKTLFPERWTDDDAMAALSQTLNQPYTTSDDHEHLVDPNFLNHYGFVDGVRLVVRLRKADGTVDTGHPLDGDGVFRNGKKAGAAKKQLPLGSVRNVPLPDGPD